MKTQLINWSDDDHTLNFDAMDDTHQEFIALLNVLYRSPDHDFQRLYDDFCQHENELMQESAFPARSEHMDEHKRILGELHRFKKRIDMGLYAFGRAYLRDSMPRWFKLHIATMDSALAAHLKTIC